MNYIQIQDSRKQLSYERKSLAVRYGAAYLTGYTTTREGTILSSPKTKIQSCSLAAVGSHRTTALLKLCCYCNVKS